ncbi:MAG: hypothetical protein F6K14_34150 [Symploca sp. SIO2C1]|nr:hypothetical protein [Symploca sp. SIO2C1]
MSNEGRNFCQILFPSAPLLGGVRGGFCLGALFLESHCKFGSPHGDEETILN